MADTSDIRESFTLPVRVYYEDTDGGGVVYHANYLRFMERARTEWLRALGFEQTRLREETGILFVVKEIALDYLAPARLDDALLITARIDRLSNAALDFVQTVTRDGQELVRAKVRIVCVNAATLRPTRIPDVVRQRLG